MKLLARLLIALALLFSAPALAVAAPPSIPPSAPVTVSTLQRATYPIIAQTDVAVLGDSRPQNSDLAWWDAAVPVGLDVSLYGWCDQTTTAGNGTLAYTFSGKTVTWASSGSSAGSSTPLVVPFTVVTDAGGHQLRLAVRSLTQQPGSDASYTVSCGGNRRFGWRSDKGSLFPWVFQELRWPTAGVRMYGVGGGKLATFNEGSSYYLGGSYGCGTTCLTIFELGTNDVSNGDTSATMIANAQTLLDKVRTSNPWRRGVILSEFARWDTTGPPNLISGAKCTALQALNAWYQDYAAKWGWLYVDLWSQSVDTSHTDCRPRTDINITTDGIHPSLSGGQFLGHVAAQQIGAWIGYGPFTRQTDPNLWSWGNIVGTSGAFGTNCSGTLPTNWKASVASGTGTCTASIVNTRDDGGPGQAVEIIGSFSVCSSAPSTTCIIDISSNGGTTMANLGTTAGTTSITSSVDYNLSAATNVTAIEVFDQFTGSSPLLNLYAMCDCGSTSNSATYLSAPSAGRFYSPSLVIPTGTTQIAKHIYVRGIAGTSFRIQIAGWANVAETTKAGLPQ